MTLLYHIIIHLFYLLMLPAAWFNPKARRWVNGRNGWRARLKQWNPAGSPTFWFHAASLGEFEQGLPVMEELKAVFPNHRLVITFYSPSGYEVRKNYAGADLVCYLPLDTSYNARAFISMIRPDMAFFIKYEFWYFYLRQLHRCGTPVYLVSGIFRRQQVFFRWYGSWFRKKLSFFTGFFLQDYGSVQLLKNIGIQSAAVTGDTRFDRVTTTALRAGTNQLAAAFAFGCTCVVAGSTWPRDEELLAHTINQADHTMRFIIAPHEVEPTHIVLLEALINKTSVRYSQASVENIAEAQVLIIDNVGMLSSLYQYGQLAYIGGGFGTGIHNVLEAAVFGVPVVFGPNYDKFREARELLACGGAYSIASAGELQLTLQKLIQNDTLREHSGAAAKEYIQKNTGATARIIQQVILNSPVIHGDAPQYTPIYP